MSQHSSTPTRKRRGMKLLVALMSALLTLGLLEGAARLYVWKNYKDPGHGMNWKFDYEPYLETRTDERFFGPFPAKSDKFRVLVIGGSTASLVPNADVAAAFEPLVGRPVEIINMAQGGYIVNQERVMLLLHGLPVKPDLLFTLNGANDIVTVSKTKQPGVTYADGFIRYGVENPVMNGLLGIVRNSQFVNCVNKLRERRVEGKVHEDAGLLDRTVDHFVEGVTSMSVMAHGSGIPHVMVIQPYLTMRKSARPEEVEQSKQYAYRTEFVANGFRKILAKLQAAQLPGQTHVIDATTAFDDTNELCFTDTVHLTDFGNRKLMTHVAAKLKERGFTAK